tara:strand:- start:68 stop:412 length:345 start_codon:yes stop_codon:yes gene_type:complete
MSWKDEIKKEDWKWLDETIRVGDYVETKRGGLLGSKVEHRNGVIETIRIAMEKGDIAGDYESGVEVERYDLALDYQGTISYGNYWTYFNSITRVVPKEELDSQGRPKDDPEHTK